MECSSTGLSPAMRGVARTGSARSAISIMWEPCRRVAFAIETKSSVRRRRNHRVLRRTALHSDFTNVEAAAGRARRNGWRASCERSRGADFPVIPTSVAGLRIERTGAAKASPFAWFTPMGRGADFGIPNRTTMNQRADCSRWAPVTWKSRNSADDQGASGFVTAVRSRGNFPWREFRGVV